MSSSARGPARADRPPGLLDRSARESVGQGDGRLSIAETLDLAWRLLAPFPDDELGRVPPALGERLRPN